MSNRKSSKWTAEMVKALKGKTKFACLTAYDYAMARIIDELGFPLIIVGDSLATTILGYDTTLPVTMNDMLHHTAAVVRGAKNALIVGDMPFMSYQAATAQAIANAGRFLKEAGADAVKVEGGAIRVPVIKALVENGIPVLGHVGLTPQSIRSMGGYKVQGKQSSEAKQLLDDALAIEKAGVFAIILECMPPELGREITQSVNVPTIGIGAGPACNGQVLVSHDLLGMGGKFHPKFVKQYANLNDAMREAFENFKKDVAREQFPGEEHCY